MPEIIANGQWTREGLMDVMEAIAGTADVADAWNLHLFQSSFVPSAASVAADFIAAEADFDGYALQPVTFTGPLVPGDGIPELVGSNEVFAATGPTPSNLIGGVVLVKHVDGTPDVDTSYVYWLFANPITINAASQFVGFKPFLSATLGPQEGVVEA